jgi:hypothetical protein
MIRDTTRLPEPPNPVTVLLGAVVEIACLAVFCAAVAMWSL